MPVIFQAVRFPPARPRSGACALRCQRSTVPRRHECPLRPLGSSPLTGTPSSALTPRPSSPSSPSPALGESRETSRMGLLSESCPFLSLFLCWLLSSVASSSVAAAPHPDYHPLQAFRSSADPTGAFLPTWAPDTDPCSGAWAGVGCRGGRVARVLLQGRGLRGPVGALCFLPHLRLLNLSRNRLTGEIPAGFLHLRRLRRLDLSGNLFSGRIPQEVGRLPRLVNLRLEGNLLTGEIPASLGSLDELVDFNVSGNRLSGRIPASLSSFPASSFTSNSDLCGGPLLRQCTNKTATSTDPLVVHSSSNDRQKGEWKLVSIAGGILLSAFSALVVLPLLLWYCRRKRRKERSEIGERSRAGAKVGGGVAGEKSVVLFDGCKAFTVDELMRGSAEMLGRGTVGTTYRVVMEGDAGRGLAVKRVRRGHKTSAAPAKGKEEKEAAAAAERLLGELGGMRHPKVAALRAYYRSEDEILLVYDYLPNGSLHGLLHGSRGPGRTPLGWAARLKLALGAADGLAFLHASSPSQLAHQHFTSSNVLVDDDGNACVSDFALLQLLAAPPPAPAEWYPTPPELLGGGGGGAARRPTQRSDVYSFGVVLLEVLTGRAAGGVGETDLAKWVQTVVREEWTSEVFDVELAGDKGAEDEMVALLQVALLCMAPAPGERPSMSVVFKMIEEIKERGSKGKGSSSPPSSLMDSSHDSSTPTVSEGTPTFVSA
ncbi:hypothetical protein Taro_012693 [Colocasia esculenta]|uniref:Protein kinase domain-containing protein n=1 Tax=Colocasia esculenta TaxID=4460 RepID=A0A843U9S3_COLES|nr:hypothetical protein [Colocasia esculenta]